MATLLHWIRSDQLSPRVSGFLQRCGACEAAMGSGLLSMASFQIRVAMASS